MLSHGDFLWSETVYYICVRDEPYAYMLKTFVCMVIIFRDLSFKIIVSSILLAVLYATILESSWDRSSSQTLSTLDSTHMQQFFIPWWLAKPGALRCGSSALQVYYGSLAKTGNIVPCTYFTQSTGYFIVVLGFRSAKSCHYDQIWKSPWNCRHCSSRSTLRHHR